MKLIVWATIILEILGSENDTCDFDSRKKGLEQAVDLDAGDDGDEHGPTLEEVLKPLNRAMYEEEMYLVNDTYFYYDQHPDSIRMAVEPRIWSFSASAEALKRATAPLSHFEQECENQSNELIMCSIENVRIAYAIQAHLFDGRAPRIVDRYPLAKVRLPGTSVEAAWDPSLKSSTGLMQPHHRDVKLPSFPVPPGNHYRLLVDFDVVDIFGYFKMDIEIGTEDSPHLEWQLQTCARQLDTGIPVSEVPCEWIDIGPFNGSEVLERLTPESREALCGQSQIPDGCWLFSKDGTLHTMAATSFQARVGVVGTVTLVDVSTNNTVETMSFE